jgi:hypothetical protein
VQKIEKFLDQNSDILIFCTKQKFFSQHPASTARRDIIQEYSVKFSDQNLQRFFLTFARKQHHRVRFPLYQQAKSLRGLIGDHFRVPVSLTWLKM